MNDKVRVFGREGYITGFTDGGVYVKDKDDKYITTPNKTYKQVSMSKLSFFMPQ